MSKSKDSSDAQDLVRCGLCIGKKNKSPADRLCSTCSADLCSECVGVHIKNSASTQHTIVGHKDRPKEELLDLNCDTHMGKCIMFCSVCDIPVCAKCLASKKHKNHELVEISLNTQLLLEKLREETEELQHCLAPGYEKLVSDLEHKRILQERSHKEVRENIIEQGTYLHHELEQIIQKHLKEAKKLEEEDLSIIGKQISDMKSILSEIQKIIKENENLLKTKTMKYLLKHVSENERFREVQKIIELSPPSFVSQRVPRETLSQMFGILNCSVRREICPYPIPSSANLLSERDGLKIPEIIRTWKTGLKVSQKISCCLESNDCYIRSGSTIKKFNATGKELSVTKLKSESHFLIDITVLEKDNLFFSDNRDRSVNFVKDNKIKTLITFDGWKPLAICFTSTDGILVSMQTDDETQSKLVRYSGTTASQEIQFKDSSTPLYSNPLFICENSNFDICVSDWDKNSVEVVDSDGEFIFSYKGNRALAKYKDKFHPRGLACDSKCHILITDFLNNLVHIVDHNGHFLRFIDNCNLYCPQDVSISRDNMLYLVENSKEELKVISYLV